MRIVRRPISLASWTTRLADVEDPEEESVQSPQVELLYVTYHPKWRSNHQAVLSRDYQ
jgi:hypothetical protein